MGGTCIDTAPTVYTIQEWNAMERGKRGLCPYLRGGVETRGSRDPGKVSARPKVTEAVRGPAQAGAGCPAALS